MSLAGKATIGWWWWWWWWWRWLGSNLVRPHLKCPCTMQPVCHGRTSHVGIEFQRRLRHNKHGQRSMKRACSFH